MTRIWVDFNDRELDGSVPAMARNANGPVAVGDQIVAFDDDGNTCRAVIVDSYDGFLSLAVSWGTFTQSRLPARKLVGA